MAFAAVGESQPAIRRTAHLDPVPGQLLASAINEHARALRAHSLDASIHRVPRHSGIPGNKGADHHANNAREDSGYTVCELIYTSAAERARLITERRTLEKPKWEADKCSKHDGYRLEGKS